MADFRYKGDAWLFDLFRESAELTSQVETTGAQILNRARANAEAFKNTGAFLGSITGELKRSKKGRPYYRVQANDPAAYSIEFGTAKRPAYRPLGRAIGVYK